MRARQKLQAFAPVRRRRFQHSTRETREELRQHLLKQRRREMTDEEREEEFLLSTASLGLEDPELAKKRRRESLNDIFEQIVGAAEGMRPYSGPSGRESGKKQSGKGSQTRRSQLSFGDVKKRLRRAHAAAFGKIELQTDRARLPLRRERTTGVTTRPATESAKKQAMRHGESRPEVAGTALPGYDYHKKTYPSRSKQVSVHPSGARVIRMYSGGGPASSAAGVTSDSFLRSVLAIEQRVRMQRRRRRVTAGVRSRQRLREPISPRRKGASDDVVGNGKEESSPPPVDPELGAQDPLRLQYDPSQMKQLTMLSPHAAHTTLNDYLMMVEACNRAGKNRLEALCHYRIGTMYEDRTTYVAAIRHFKKFRFICEGMKDRTGTCLGLNRLGVLYQLMGGKKNLERALELHLRHWEIADVQNKIVAHINMGLIFQCSRPPDTKHAIDQFRMAFQYAVQIGDQHGQSISVANLGALQKSSGQLGMAKACLKQHLALSESIRDNKAKSEAYEKLGMLASKKGDSEKAEKMLTQARDIARQHNDQKKSNQLKCFLGIIRGNSELGFRIDQILRGLSREAGGAEDDASAGGLDGEEEEFEEGEFEGEQFGDAEGLEEGEPDGYGSYPVEEGGEYQSGEEAGEEWGEVEYAEDDVDEGQYELMGADDLLDLSDDEEEGELQ